MWTENSFVEQEVGIRVGDGRMDQVEAPATKHSDLVELPRNQIWMEGENRPHKVVL